MNKNLKRRLYAIALAGVLLTTPKITAYADEVDMTPIDIDSAISELVPGYSDNNNNDNNNANNNNNNDNSNNASCCSHACCCRCCCNNISAVSKIRPFIMFSIACNLYSQCF